MLVQLTEAGAVVKAKRQEWMSFYQGFQKVGDAAAPVMTGADMDKFKAYEAEVGELQAKYDGLLAAYQASEQNRELVGKGVIIPPTPQYGGGGQFKTIPQMAREAGYKWVVGSAIEVDCDAKAYVFGERKATMTTSANGYPPQVLRDGNVVPLPSRPPQLIDFLRIDPTTQNAIKYMAQTVRTNAAGAANEGSALSEATITYAEQTDIISKVGTFIPVTEEQLEDESELQTLVEDDLSLMVRQELDRQVSVGNGTDPELLGIYNGGSIQTQARGSDPTLDAILKAITLVNVVARANAGVVALHGYDHQRLALTRTAEGLYILGNPSDAPIMRVWGLPIAKSEALTETNGLVLDPFYFRVKMRKGLMLAVANQHASNFTSGILVIRAHVRAGIQRLRESAACKVTGLPTT